MNCNTAIGVDMAVSVSGHHGRSFFVLENEKRDCVEKGKREMKMRPKLEKISVSDIV